ncbi:hypothetical protein ACA910_003851 [Epithemia clementina (nom. ined.)]
MIASKRAGRAKEKGGEGASDKEIDKENDTTTNNSNWITFKTPPAAIRQTGMTNGSGDESSTNEKEGGDKLALGSSVGTNKKLTKSLFSPACIYYLIQQHESLLNDATSKISPLANNNSSASARSSTYGDDTPLDHTPPPPFSSPNMALATAKRLALEETEQPTTGNRTENQQSMIRQSLQAFSLQAFSCNSSRTIERDRPSLVEHNQSVNKATNARSPATFRGSSLCKQQMPQHEQSDALVCERHDLIKRCSWNGSLAASILTLSTSILNVLFLFLIHSGAINVSVNVLTGWFELFHPMISFLLKLAIFGNVVFIFLIHVGGATKF